MSFDDYARYIAQKYRLAISIAILNIKPADLSIDEFLNQIKTTINERNETDELNISACSDDFNIDSDEINLDQVIDQSTSHNNEQFDIDKYMNQNRLSYNTFSKHNYAVDNESATKRKGVGRESTGTNKGVDNTTQDSEDREARNVNFKVTDVNKQKKEKFRELIKVLKGEDVVTTAMNKDTNTEESLTFDIMDIDLTQCYDTEINSLDLLNFDKNLEQISRNQLESQKYEPNNDCTNTSNTFEKGIGKDIRKRLNDATCGREFKIAKNINKITEKNTKDIRNETENDVNVYVFSEFYDQNIHKTNMVTNNEKMVFKPNPSESNKDDTELANKSSNHNLNAIRHKVQNQFNPVFIDMDTKETIIYTDTQTNTHYSESQMIDMTVDKQFINGNKHIDFSKKKLSNMELNSQNYRKENQTSLEQNKENTLEIQTQNTNNENFTNFIEKDAAFKEINIKNDKAKINNELAQSNAIFDKTINTDDTTFLTEMDCTISDKTSSDTNEGLKDGNEKIPFKIIEEINRIKIYLRRNEKDKSDFTSSNSQNKPFGGTPNNHWIGQSASNIFNYLNTCALIASTQHLNQQISEVLGQLIDRLHEQEIYPKFLEDLLTTVEDILRSLYEEESYVFDVLFKKDEQLQRLLFLNKSVHVQKFTIDKINEILQKLLKESADTTIERQDINKTENLCYIFEILQILLPKYSVGNKNSQTSQDEKVLRKKDITEIWRKKWIDKKIEKDEGSCETKCVLKECSAILNKIIINFMDGYSLIAYSALNCFNLMQS